ncbi:DUF3983 domain-containing protein [Bacillus thuringiensis]|nr:DUF3983 domain-containing protein [Bacillus thuringiensis]
MTKMKKKRLKKEIARRTKAVQKEEKDRLDKAWRNLFTEPSILK